MKSYRVRLDLQIGSNYFLVYIELDLSIEEASTTRRRAWKIVKPETVKTAIRRLIYSLPPNQLKTKAEIDEYLGDIITGLRKVVEETVL